MNVNVNATTQDEFIAARNRDWDELDGLISRADDHGVRKLEPAQIARLGALYRALSGDIARAESHHFSGDLLALLERLAARAHSTLYAAPPWRLRSLWDFLAAGFPRALRRQRTYFLVSLALFFVPMLIGFLGAALSPSFAERILPPEALAQVGQSYGEQFGHGRAAGEGAMMTGFYIMNNVGIAFRCFATGVFFGLGSAFFLVYNGLTIGAVLGYVVSLGYGGHIGSFVVGHAAFELTAIVIAGAAGLRMGYALVATGGESRLGSLRRHGPEVVQLVLGAGAMLLVAAFIEGLWSGSALPAVVKYAVAAVLWTLVVLYLTRAGREPGPARMAGES